MDNAVPDEDFVGIGKVTSGMEVIDAIAQVPPEQRGGFDARPTEDVVIVSVIRLPRRDELLARGLGGVASERLEH